MLVRAARLVPAVALTVFVAWPLATMGAGH
ncbi:MAG: hypothetical protein RL330_1092, partial [Actinomycetota bacterium]